MTRKHKFLIVVLIAALASFTAANSAPKPVKPKNPMKDNVAKKQLAQPEAKQPAKTPKATPCEQPADPKNKGKGVDVFMREKLVAAKMVVEGLTMEDFDLMRKGAEKMIVMSHAADWQVLQGPVYIQDSADFRSAAKQIVESCDELSLEGAMMGYLEVSLSCVRCHKHIRKAKFAFAEPADGKPTELTSLPKLNSVLVDVELPTGK